MPDDIHQDRFALMAALTRAHDARPDEFADSETLMSMSDEDLLAHATELLHSLERGPLEDDAVLEVQAALRRILVGTQGKHPA